MDDTGVIRDLRAYHFVGQDDQSQHCLVFISRPVTGLNPRKRRRMDWYAQDVATVFHRTLLAGLSIEVYKGGSFADPDAQDDILPAEVFNAVVDKVAGAAALFAFVNPPALGVGREMALADAGGIPVVMMMKTGVEKDGTVRPAYIEGLNGFTNPERFRGISRIVRGERLGGSYDVVLFGDRVTLQENLGSYLQTHGVPLLRRGLDEMRRRANWKPDVDLMLKRRRLLGLDRRTFSAKARCHPGIIERIERNPLIMALLANSETRQLLKPLGFEFGCRVERSGAAFGTLPTTTFPMPEKTVRKLEIALDTLATYLASRANTDVDGEDLWTNARERTRLPSFMFDGVRWNVVDRPGDSESQSSAQPLLFSEGASALEESYYTPIPSTVFAWQTFEGRLRRESEDHK